MSVVLFYHLSRSSIEQTARALLARALGQGWKVVVRSGSNARLDHLDRDLWLGSEDDFLAHGRAGGPHDARQPILLTEGSDIPNNAQGLMLLDGAPLDFQQAAALKRVWVLFEEEDTAGRQMARDLWSRLGKSGLATQYWAEEAGTWTKKMDRPATHQV